MEKYCLRSPNYKNISLFVFRTLQRRRLGTCTCPGKPQTLTPDSAGGREGETLAETQRRSCAPVWRVRGVRSPVTDDAVTGASKHGRNRRPETSTEEFTRRLRYDWRLWTRREKATFMFSLREAFHVYSFDSCRCAEESSVVSSPGDKLPHSDYKSNLFWATLHRVLVLDYAKSSPVVQLFEYCQLN